jgi:hypothetical protein
MGGAAMIEHARISTESLTLRAMEDAFAVGRPTHLRVSRDAVTDYIRAVDASATASLVRMSQSAEDDARHAAYVDGMKAHAESVGGKYTGCSWNGLPLVIDETLPPRTMAACE